MKLLKITQSPTSSEIWAEIVRYGNTINILISGPFMNEAVIWYLMECDNVSNLEFTPGEELSLTLENWDGTTVDYCFKRQYS